MYFGDSFSLNDPTQTHLQNFSLWLVDEGFDSGIGGITSYRFKNAVCASQFAFNKKC